MTLTFGNSPVFVGFCDICGLPLEQDGACRKYHKIGIKKQRQPKTHGKSKSDNRWNNA